MGALYQHIVRPVLFGLSRSDPEIAHDITIAGLEAVSKRPMLRGVLRWRCQVIDPRLEQRIWGLNFPNPIGLAAGGVKNAEGLHALEALGFGWVTAGTVVPQPQPGNPRPRTLRIPQVGGLINRMGFNSEGIAAVSQRMTWRSFERGTLTIPLGLSIGKQKDTPIEEAIRDYLFCIERMSPFVKFIEVNVSSPNTPELRKLQTRQYLRDFLQEIIRKVRSMAIAAGVEVNPKPVIVKISPDMVSVYEVAPIIQVCQEVGVAGIAAVNTTTGRQYLTDRGIRIAEQGGLSGPALRTQALNIIRFISRETNGLYPIIGIGGVNSVHSALEMIRAGAWLVGVLTGVMYEGPFLASHINRGIVKFLERHSIPDISHLRGWSENIGG
ncbi:MAG TPA: quinone-dependent dihydroorotate dehydrogenase [Patescibacteria group bacterium]|nr:quinone-dependent dihydroorotate dehydrogenase [Patescibacteria group bacterium]